MTVIQCSSFRLRSWRLDDAAALVKYANNEAVSRNLRDAFPHPYTADDATRWLAHTVGTDPVTNLAIEIDGEAAGSVGLHVQSDVYHRVAEIGYWLAEPHWNRGIMSEAVSAATTYAFERFPLDRVEAEVFARNTASMRVLERCGYRLEGRLRDRVTKGDETMDAMMYAIVRSEWAAARQVKNASGA